ncbi:MAG: type II toxin-antitoxin system RelE/ParE family toxin [Pirellulales bacterium]|nr:type II toxin-antitoxin system RelE/ParE family toxin [Pirellulales bacterium]
MKPLAVEIHPEAVAEARAAHEWYDARSPDASEAFLAELDVGIESVRTAPELYPQYLHGTRRYLLRRFPYLIVFRVVSEAVQVVAIAHTRRRPGYWKTRSVS